MRHLKSGNLAERPKPVVKHLRAATDASQGEGRVAMLWLGRTSTWHCRIVWYHRRQPGGGRQRQRYLTSQRYNIGSYIGTYGRFLAIVVRVFASESGKESVEDLNYSAGYASLVKHVRCMGVGSLAGMGYKTFSRWMQGKRTSKKNVAKRNLVMFQDYVDRHGEGADEKCMCLGQE